MFEFNGKIAEQRQQLQAELQDNVRLRFGILMILVLVLTWVSLVWADINQALYEDVKYKEAELLALGELEAEAVWQQRLAETGNVEQALRGQLWSAASAGLVQARIQAAIDQAIRRDEGIRQVVNVGVPQPVDEVPGVSRLRLRVGTSLTPAQLMEALANLEGSPNKLWIERLELRRTGLRWNVELMLAAYLSTGDGA